MRPAIAQNVTPVPVAAGFGPAIPAGRRATVDLDHPVAAKAVDRGRLKVLRELEAEAGPVDLSGVEDLTGYSAAEVIAYLEALTGDGAPAEAQRIAAAELAGKGRSTILAAAERLTPTTTPDEE